MAGSWLLVAIARAISASATLVPPRSGAILPSPPAVRTSGGRPADVRGGIQEVAKANFGGAQFGSTVAGVTADEEHGDLE
jgi:hypothetical protein